MSPKFIALSLLVLFMTGCGSTADAPLAVVAPAPQPPPADPRVSELQVVVNELLDRIEVMNARLQKLEAGAVEPPQRVAATPARRTESQPVPTASPSPMSASRPLVPGTAAQIGEAYKEGLTLFGRGQIDRSRAVFQQVFDADPSGDLADNALYWVGETYYTTGKYTEALAHYKRVTAEYAQQNKAPDALLRIGMIQAKQGDLVLARQTLNQVLASYPYSTAAAAAKGELKRIQY